LLSRAPPDLKDAPRSSESRSLRDKPHPPRPDLPISARPPCTERTHRTSRDGHCPARQIGTYALVVMHPRNAGYGRGRTAVADFLMARSCVRSAASDPSIGTHATL